MPSNPRKDKLFALPGTLDAAECPSRADMLDYHPFAVPIVACPFCREMFEKAEETRCPVCGIDLLAFEKLPPAPHLHAELDDLEDGVPLTPEHERFPLAYAGRGRAMVVALGFVGLLLFFLPWVRLTLPYTAQISGFDLAHRLGWSWAGGVAWGVLVPTVASRRTIAQLRGARVAAAFLAGIPGMVVGILVAFPPHGGLIPVVFTYSWPLWCTLAASVTGIVLALRLGGRADDIVVDRGTSEGQALH
jgi:hypothetical protein